MLGKLKQIIKRLLHKVDIDRAVFFGLSSKLWGIISGPITALLIVSKFTPELQGYYYTFASLLALQVFMELGLGTVIIQFTSHEWSRLSLDNSGRITGNAEALSRLISLARVSLKWFGAVSIIFVCGLMIGGYIFFSKSHDAGVNWTLPWFALCLLSGITVFLVPVWSLLEGCNQVVNLYKYRFIQNLCSSIIVWMAILSGAKLWTTVFLMLTILICAKVFLQNKYQFFLKTLFFSMPTGPVIKWRKDIFPMQWRFAISWISGYFAFSLFTPVLFHYNGAVIAGQMGMTWTIVNVVVFISSSWLNPKVPQFGMLIAQKKYNELDKLFWRTTKIIIIVTVGSASIIWSMVYFLNMMKHPIASRFLPMLPTSIFLLAQLILTISAPFAAYLRAHKKEPLLFLSLSAGIYIGLSTLILGKLYSVTEIAAGYLSANLVLIPIVIIIWYRCKIEWHKDGDAEKVVLN